MKDTKELEFNPYEKAIKKKVAICGTAPTINNAPFGDQDFDIWGVAHCAFLAQVTRMDAIFEIHKKEVWMKDNAPFHRFPNATIWMLDHDDLHPKSVKYPVKDILEKYSVNKGFPGKERYYMSSSLPYMIALAIEKGYEEIHLYGIHLLMEEEYFYQRPCLEYYAGIAVGKGIKLYSDPGADILCFGYVYGLQEKEADEMIAKLKVRLDEFDARLAATNQELFGRSEQLKASINQLQGAREQVLYDLRSLGKDIKKVDYVKF